MKIKNIRFTDTHIIGAKKSPGSADGRGVS